MEHQAPRQQDQLQQASAQSIRPAIQSGFFWQQGKVFQAWQPWRA